MVDLATAFVGIVFVVVAGPWLARRRRTLPALAAVLAGLVVVAWVIWSSV